MESVLPALGFVFLSINVWDVQSPNRESLYYVSLLAWLFSTAFKLGLLFTPSLWLDSEEAAMKWWGHLSLNSSPVSMFPASTFTCSSSDYLPVLPFPLLVLSHVYLYRYSLAKIENEGCMQETHPIYSSNIPIMFQSTALLYLLAIWWSWNTPVWCL